MALSSDGATDRRSGQLLSSGGAVSDGAVSDGAVSDGAVSDGAVSDGAVSDGAVSDGAVSDGATDRRSGQRLSSGGAVSDYEKGGMSALIACFDRRQKVFFRFTEHGMKNRLDWKLSFPGAAENSVFIHLIYPCVKELDVWMACTQLRVTKLFKGVFDVDCSCQR